MESRYITSVGQLSAEENLLLFAPVYEHLVQSREPVILYGCGPLTELLFARYDIEKLKILGVSDGNPLKWGGEFFNKKIIAPNEINSFDKAAVLIISGSSQPEIIQRLENLLKPGIRLEPALQFHYFNTIEEMENRENLLPSWEKQWNTWKEPLESAHHILCLVEGDTLEPFFLHGMTAVKEKLTVLALSPYIYKGLKERGFKAIDLRDLWKSFQHEFSRNHDMIAVEGERITSVNRSALAEGLTFGNTNQKIFDAVFYDRLIFPLLQNSGLQEFAAHLITQESWDVCWYIGPFQEAEPAAILVHCRQKQIPTCLFYTDREENPLIEESLRELGTTRIQTGHVIEEWENARLAGILQNLDMVPLRPPGFTQPITLIPFILSRRWETRELVNHTLKNLSSSGQANELIIVKCREKVRHFNGVIGEADFCREYMAEILEKEDRVIVLDDRLTDLEAVRLAHRILAAEPCRITSMAGAMGKKWETI